MEFSDTPRRSGRLVRLSLLVVAALTMLSPAFGRADPTGSYRPLLPPDALTTGCWPLPGNVQLDFGYQVRIDERLATAHGPRRMLVLHYDEISGVEAARRVRTAFRAAGVRDAELVTVDFAATAPDAVVRGQMVLDLPPSRPERGSTCRAQPFSTKKFPFAMDDRS